MVLVLLHEKEQPIMTDKGKTKHREHNLQNLKRHISIIVVILFLCRKMMVVHLSSPVTETVKF